MARIEFNLVDGQPVYEGSSDTSQYRFFDSKAKFSTLPFEDQESFLDQDLLKLELVKDEFRTGDFFFLRVPGSVKDRIGDILEELGENPGPRRSLELNLEFEDVIKRIVSNPF